MIPITHIPNPASLYCRLEAFRIVEAERLRQSELGHSIEHSPFEWLQLLAEELGEFAREVGHDLSRPGAGGEPIELGEVEEEFFEALRKADEGACFLQRSEFPEPADGDLLRELVHVAATAIAAIEATLGRSDSEELDR